MTKFSKTGVIIREHVTLALSTLAADVAIKFGSVPITEDFRMLKSVLTAQIQGLTNAEGNGLLLGIANNDLSAVQIAEALTVDGPLDFADRDLIEQANRFAKIFAAHYTIDPAHATGMFRNENNGPILEVKPRWTFASGKGWSWFIFNSGDALTTGSSVTIVASDYGLWVV